MSGRSPHLLLKPCRKMAVAECSAAAGIMMGSGKAGSFIDTCHPFDISLEGSIVAMCRVLGGKARKRSPLKTAGTTPSKPTKRQKTSKTAHLQIERGAFDEGHRTWPVCKKGIEGTAEHERSRSTKPLHNLVRPSPPDESIKGKCPPSRMGMSMDKKILKTVIACRDSCLPPRHTQNPEQSRAQITRKIHSRSQGVQQMGVGPFKQAQAKLFPS